MRFVTAAVGLSAVLMLGACATPAVAPALEVTVPTPVESPEPAFENRSEPFGSWKLEPGIPENTPADVPFPEDRWIEESSVAFDDEGGMIDLWVTADEFDRVIRVFEDAGWVFGERSENAGRVTVVAFDAEQDRALNFIFNPERDDRDSRLTVTYVASVRG